MPAYRHFGGLVLAAGLLGACADDGTTAPAMPAYAVEDAGHNAVDHFKIDEPAEFTFQSPCNGESIDFVVRDVGEITFVDTREHLDQGFALHIEHHSTVTGTGTGEVTGIVYSINDVFNERFESPSPPAPQYTSSFTETLHVRSPVPGTSFTARFGVTVVLPPSDGVKVTREIESATCGQ
jgi:hypothetical protein